MRTPSATPKTLSEHHILQICDQDSDQESADNDVMSSSCSSVFLPLHGVLKKSKQTKNYQPPDKKLTCCIVCMLHVMVTVPVSLCFSSSSHTVDTAGQSSTPEGSKLFFQGGTLQNEPKINPTDVIQSQFKAQTSCSVVLVKCLLKGFAKHNKTQTLNILKLCRVLMSKQEFNVRVCVYHNRTTDVNLTGPKTDAIQSQDALGALGDFLVWEFVKY